ncbi:hypothetical protein NDU88_002166 [Pleurodeles waltl]|uniref:Uncharacterized protein n=1 Tax=Pleurodeles waltl TaxID=8319 RepID=A0AAV7MMJ8_PLEWA|nr:hypothetical protein NDU88_002166 [Pleurodeles waltl]
MTHHGARGVSYLCARPCLLTRGTGRGCVGETTLWEQNGAPRDTRCVTDVRPTVSALLRHASRQRPHFRKRHIRSHDAGSFRRCTYDMPYN